MAERDVLVGARGREEGVDAAVGDGDPVAMEGELIGEGGRAGLGCGWENLEEGRRRIGGLRCDGGINDGGEDFAKEGGRG